MAVVTMLWDTPRSTALYVCLGCAALVLGACYKGREAQELAQSSTANAPQTTGSLTVTVGLPGMGSAVTPKNESTMDVNISAVSRGQVGTDSTFRRSGRMIRQPAKLLDGVDVWVAPTNNLRNVAYEQTAVTAEMCAIGLRSDGSRTLLR